MLKILINIGQISGIVSNSTIAAAEQDLNQLDINNVTHFYSSAFFAPRYDQTKSGFVQLVNDANKTFYNLDIDLKQAEVFYYQNSQQANIWINDTNNHLRTRSFWSSIGHFFSSMGHAIEATKSSVSAALTFGLVDSINNEVVDHVVEAHENLLGRGSSALGEIIEDGGNMVSAVAHGLGVVGSIAEGDLGNALSEAIDAGSDLGSVFF